MILAGPSAYLSIYNHSNVHSKVMLTSCLGRTLGGVQNIGKKEKDKEKKEEGKSRRLRFPTGSGLAGIRGFH